MTWLRRIGRDVGTVDWAPASMTAAVRAAVLTAALLTWAVADHDVDALVPAAIGLLFVCVADPVGTEDHRRRTMAWFALWGTVATLLGGLVSDDVVAQIAMAVPVAFVAGYAGASGPVGQANGMLSLVLYAIAAGTPVAMDLSLQDALMLGAGAVIGGLVIALPGVAPRARSPRAAFAHFARGLGHARVTDPLALGAAVHATRERQFAETVAAERGDPVVTQWLEGLATQAHRTRLAMLGLASAAQEMEGAALERTLTFLRAACRTCRAAGACAVWSVRRPGLRRARRALDDAAERMAEDPDPGVARVAREVRDGLDAIADLLLEPWPTRSASPGAVAAKAAPALHSADHPGRAAAAWRAHFTASDPFLRHAVRLAIVFTVATALAAALDLPHPYWLPMTVAWISKPTMSDTTVRVAARVAGTILGVVISAIVMEGFDPGDWTLMVLVSLSALVSILFLAANYALAVSAITTFVFFLFALGGEDVDSSFSSRLLATVLAGVLVLLGAFLWPTRSGKGVPGALADYADALGGYADPVLRGVERDEASRRASQSAVLAARTNAASALRATEFEVGRHPLHPETTRAVLEWLHLATSHCVRRELAGAGPDDVVVAAPVVVELRDLHARLVEVQAGRPVPERRHPPALDHPVHRSVRHAHEALDLDRAHAARV